MREFTPATAKQISFLESLIATRDIPTDYADVFAAIDLSTLGVPNASGLIDELLKYPVRRRAAAPSNYFANGGTDFQGHARSAAPRTDLNGYGTAPEFANVPAGHYAIDIDGAVAFFKVGRPTEGKWAGRVFVDQQASDTMYPVRNPARKAAVLAAIAVDPQAALIRYGRELGVCGVCGRTLTDAASIAAGIGPICAGRSN